MPTHSVCPACNQASESEGPCPHCGGGALGREWLALMSEVESRAEKEWHLACQHFPSIHFSFRAFVMRLMDIVQSHFSSGNQASKTAANARDLQQFLDSLSWIDLFLASACAAGDAEAWEIFHSKYQMTIRSTAFRAASNSLDAAELADTVMTDLFLPASSSDSRKESKIGQYHGLGSLDGWIKVVIHRMVIDRFRKQRKSTPLEELDWEPTAGSATSRADHRVETRDLLKAVNMVTVALTVAVQQLDARSRLALTLYYVQGLSLKEISRWLKSHESTASRFLDRLREQLRKAMTKHLVKEFRVRKDEIPHLIDLASSHLNLELKRVLDE